MSDIAYRYYQKQYDDCRTRGLTAAMSDVESADWVGYLIGFNYVMTGCPLRYAPAPGGITVFGPGNVAAAGVSRGRLGRDDAAVLIAEYVSVFCETLSLPPVECRIVEAQLRSTAETQTDPSASSTLSLCDVDGDAGSLGAMSLRAGLDAGDRGVD